MPVHLPVPVHPGSGSSRFTATPVPVHPVPVLGNLVHASSGSCRFRFSTPVPVPVQVLVPVHGLPEITMNIILDDSDAK